MRDFFSIFESFAFYVVSFKRFPAKSAKLES
jgi:hypothetical protein